MPPGKARQQNLRLQIAAAAARIMAEDGIDDFALAKRKAARQLGLDDAHSLPRNEEVEEQLRAYQALYQDDDQPQCLAELREIALELMQELADFRPYLTGPVLKGTAGRHSDIDLQLFTDDPKAVEFHLINQRIRYEASEKRRFTGDQTRAVSVLKVDLDGVTVNLTIFTLNDERSTIKTSSGGKPIDRAGIAAVARLMDSETEVQDDA